MELGKRIQSNTFLRNNIVYFSGSIVVSAFNYLYYPVLGRLMEPAQFGEVQTIISFFLQAAVFLQVLGLVTVGIIKKYRDTAEQEALITEVSRLALLISLVIFFFTMILSPLLQSFFQFDSVLPFIALGFALLVNVPLAFANSYLQGHQRFGDLSRSGIIASASKLIFAVLLVLAGLQAFGAIIAMALASLLSLVYALSRNRGAIHFIRNNLVLKPIQLNKIRPELRYGLFIFIISLTINLLLSLDILVIKHYFSPLDAGLYAGIATIARIIFFLTGPLAVVLIASVELTNDAHNWQVLRRTLGLTALLGGGAFLVFAALPNLVISLMLGSKYLVYADLLPRLSLAILILSFATVVAYYCIALRRYSVAPYAIASLIATAALLIAFHSSMTMVVNSLIIGGLLLLVLLCWGGRPRMVPA